jgi:thiamine-phosphate pyrophosphorylase
MDKLARAYPEAIMLREKDLTEGVYGRLARSCADICQRYGVRFIVHSFVNVALDMGAGLHLSMDDFMAQGYDLPGDVCGQLRGKARLARPVRIGVSIHSVAEAVLAERSGAAYVVAGHIFATDSKKGAPPRGLEFLGDVCGAVAIPVYAIGGMMPETIPLVRDKGAAGVCVMSPLMRAERPEGVVEAYKAAISS